MSIVNIPRNIDVLALVRSNKFDFDACSRELDYCLNSEQIRHAFATKSAEQTKSQSSQNIQRKISALDLTSSVSTRDTRRPEKSNSSYDKTKFLTTNQSKIEVGRNGNPMSMNFTNILSEQEIDMIDEVLDSIETDNNNPDISDTFAWAEAKLQRYSEHKEKDSTSCSIQDTFVLRPPPPSHPQPVDEYSKKEYNSSIDFHIQLKNRGFQRYFCCVNAEDESSVDDDGSHY